MAYTLKVNGKTLNTINGKILKTLIYKGISYEIVSGSGDVELPDDTTIIIYRTTGAIGRCKITFNKLDTNLTEVYFDNTLLISFTDVGEHEVFVHKEDNAHEITFKGLGKFEIGDTVFYQRESETTTSSGTKYVWEDEEVIQGITFGKNYGSYLGKGFKVRNSKPLTTDTIVPKDLTSFSNNLYELRTTGVLKVQEGNPVLDSRNNCNAIIETSTNILKAGTLHTTIPSSVSTIGESSFKYFNMESFYFPNHIKTIESNAFYLCQNLTEIILNDGLETINTSAFADCSAIMNINVPSSVSYIGNTAFPTNANLVITFNQTETDTLVFENQPFKKAKKATAMTIQHYGNPTVLNYDWASINITPTFVDLREQQ